LLSLPSRHPYIPDSQKFLLLTLAADRETGKEDYQEENNIAVLWTELFLSPALAVDT